MLSIRPVLMRELLVQGRALFVQHHADVGLDVGPSGDNPPLSIDDRMFETLEHVGAILAFGLFTPEDELVGYAVGIVHQHQFAAQKVCSACALFIAKPHRGRGNCWGLMDTLERAAAAQGAATHWHAKQGSRFESILRTRECRELETIFVARTR